MLTLTLQIFRVHNALFRFSLAVFFPALILTASFEVTPDIGQSLYWGQGMRSLIFPLIPAFFLISILYYLHKLPANKISPVWLVVVGLLSFIAGGFGETYVTIQTAVFGFCLFLAYFAKPVGFRKNIFPVLFSALIFSLGAMAVTVAAPGNRIRQAYFAPSPDLLNLLLISSRSFGSFLMSIVNSWAHLLMLLILLAASGFAGYLYANKVNMSSFDSPAPLTFPDHPFFSGFARTSVTLFVMAGLLLFACFVPAAYGMSTPPPDRTVIIPVVILCVFLAIFGTVLGMQLQAKQWFSEKDTLLISRAVFWLLFFLSSFFTWQVTSRILALQPDYQHFAEAFDSADFLIREAVSKGETSVSVPEVHNHFGLSDYGAGTTFWLDEAVNSYYGINVIVNKNMKP
jgi:hypothetical protein